VRKRYLQGDSEVVEAVKRLIRIAEEGERAIIESDWDSLGELMNENYDIAREVGWAFEIDDRLHDT